MNIKTIIIIFSLLVASNSYANVGRVTGLPLPRFVSLKSNKTNFRVGPSDNHSIKWVYLKKNYPVQIIAEFEHWRKVKDIDGEEGWAHESMLSGFRNILVINHKSNDIFSKKNSSIELLLQRKPDLKAQYVARIEIGVVCKLKQCNVNWCELDCEGNRGWLLKQNIWGITSADVNVKFK